MIKHFRVPGMLATRLEESGVSVHAVLRSAALPQDFFQHTRILVSTPELFALWRAIGDVSKDASIGLKLGTETRTERFHPIGIAALSTENFGAAIRHMAHYKRLSAPEEILIDHAEDEWTIRFRWTLAVEVEPAVLIEHCFAWVLTIARQGTGQKISPLRIELVQPRSHWKALERHFGCPVIFSAHNNALVFRTSAAALPFVTRNAELLDMLAPQFDVELQQRTGNQDSFVELVRSAIQQKLTGHRPVIDDIAQDLRLSPRTLQRRLQGLGSSFQRVLDEARHEMARYYLRNSVLELGEAAYLLGYEDSNSFARAFRSWEGMPPKHWRETHQGSTETRSEARPN